ncbi:DUF4300 family protein [Moraxella sp. ZJ142]|uniref:DUF4300 family protein n=1 Tax=Moraxella marmotae TaxID=3344520 RepID=UPI0035D41E69
MKKFSLLFLSIILAACTPSNQTANKADEHAQQSATEAKNSTVQLSNLADKASQDEVRATLSKYLPAERVAAVMDWVVDYNTTIKNTSLVNGFGTDKPQYDTVAIDTLWQNAKKDFVGTNCRINTFALLKDNLQINDAPANDSLLFIDHDAIDAGGLFTASDLSKFDRLYGKVKTEATKDARVHADKMKAYFDGIKFDDNATMLSVVIHDDLDGGDFLFIGHVGVLVPADKGYLFIEKISFQEPYQAIKFASKDDAYSYLFDKYAISYDQPTAQPFIMENDKLVKYQAVE